MAHELTLATILHCTNGDAVRETLSETILGVLNGQGLFNEATAPKEFHRKLQTVFGNGATVLEKVIVKDLFRKLNIPYNSQDRFDYGEALERAKEACAVEVRTK